MLAIIQKLLANHRLRCEKRTWDSDAPHTKKRAGIQRNLDAQNVGDEVLPASIEVSITSEGSEAKDPSIDTACQEDSLANIIAVHSEPSSVQIRLLPHQKPSATKLSDICDARQNRSLEALFQAADSELQNYNAADVSPANVFTVKCITSHNQASELPHTTSYPCVTASIPTSSSNFLKIKSFVPFVKLNFNPVSAKPETVSLQPIPQFNSDSSDAVVSSCPVGSNNKQLDIKTPPSGDVDQHDNSVSAGRSGHRLKHLSKSGKFMYIHKLGKYVCTYCGRGCAKPSVLQKHLRTHTGERPYPCAECGFHFKTKSNLYKHCKSRAHLTKLDSVGHVSTCFPTLETSSSSLGRETESLETLPKCTSTLEETPAEEVEIPNMKQASSVLFKFPSCDSQQLGISGTEFNTQSVTPTTRSLSVPESNGDKISGGPCSLLRLADGSVYMMEKLSNGQAILRPILQEVAIPLPNSMLATVPRSVSTKHSGWTVSTQDGTKLVTSSAMCPEVKQQVPVTESLRISLESRNPSLIELNRNVVSYQSHQKLLQKSLSANIAIATSNPAPTSSVRCLPLSTAHTVTIAPKMAPIDPKNVTPEAVQERIALLISQNASIIDTPMADAPRPKRVLRHNSEATTANNVKSDSGSGAVMKQLQRTKSLTPYTGISQNLMKQDVLQAVVRFSTSSDSSKLSTVKTHSTESMTVDVSSRTTSKFLLVPSNPNLQEVRPPLQSTAVKQPMNEPDFLNFLPLVPKPVFQFKAKSLDISGNRYENTAGTPFSTKDLVTSTVLTLAKESNRLEESEIGCKMAVCEGGNGSSSKTIQTSQDIHVVFHLPNSISQELLTSSTKQDRLSISLAGSQIIPNVKDIYEKRLEFARGHVVMENHGDQAMTNSLTDMQVDGSQFTVSSSSVPLQYLIIPADINQTHRFVPIMPLSTMAPKCIEPIEQDMPPELTTVESQHVSKSSRPKDVRNKLKVSSVTSSPTVYGSSTFSSIPSICVTPADAVQSMEMPESLWKLKLKGRLLMKRSLSIEKMLSEENESSSSRLFDSSKLSVTAKTLQSSETSVFHDSGLQRSCSYDAAMPLKKRRKTLTELGRGTAFGTRIEDAGESSHVLVSSTESAPSKAAPSSVEVVLMSENSHDTCLTKQSAASDNSLGRLVAESNCEKNVFLKQSFQSPCLPHAKNDTPTNQGLERFNMPSLICSSRAYEKVPGVLNLPLALADKVPGLLQDSRLIVPMEDSVCQTNESNVNEVSSKQSDNTNGICATIGITDTLSNAVACSTLIDIQTLVTDSVESRNVHSQNETVLVRNSIESVLLLLGHLYPSLNPSTNTTFCSVLKPQPMYLPQDANNKLSMYSTWQVAPFSSACSVSPDLSIQDMLALYQMNRTLSQQLYTTSNLSEPKSGVLTHSSYWNFKKVLEMKAKSQEEMTSIDRDNVCEPISENVCQISEADSILEFTDDTSLHSNAGSSQNTINTCLNKTITVDVAVNGTVSKETKRIQIFPGGYKSNEDYVYIRGRGKGKYVCEACGIRCKKPSMLKKHLRTHTDIRPHHCSVCSFGFKTKGNLSKHIKSKAHHSRCSDLGISLDQRASLTSDDGSSFDSQLPIPTSSMENSGSVSANFTLTSDDMQEEEDFDDAESDDDNEDDDGDSLEAEDGDNLVISSDTDNFRESADEQGNERQLKSDKNVYICQDKKADIIQSVSEAAASLLDLSKGDSININMSSPVEAARNLSSLASDTALLLTPPIESVDHDVPTSMETIPWSSTDPMFIMDSISSAGSEPAGGPMYLMHPVLHSTSQHGQAESQEASNRCKDAPLRPTGFIPPVLLIANSSSSSLQVPRPVFIAFSSASTTSSIQNSYLHPLVLVNPSLLLQKVLESNKQLPSKSQLPQSSDEVSFCSSDGDANTVKTSTIFPPVGSEMSPLFPSQPPEVISATEGNKPRVTCEIVPVPGKVCGSVEECIDGKYVCAVCHKSFGKLHQLTLHKNIHYLERPFRCGDCGSSFQNRTLLDRHQRSEKHTCKSDDPRPFKCDNCGVAFRIHGHLAKHLRSKVHIAKCEGQSKTPTKGFLSDKDSEENESESQIETCQVIDLGNNNRDNSEMLDADSRSPTVEVETADESQQQLLKTYEATCKKNSFVIMSGSPENSTPRTTEMLISGLPLSACHRCDICMKTFQDSALFEKHIGSHVELRPYICEFCDAGFTNVRLLNAHLNTHNQTKENICGVCGDFLSGKQQCSQEKLEVQDSVSNKCNLPSNTSATQFLPSDTSATQFVSTLTGNQSFLVSSNAVNMGFLHVLPEIPIVSHDEPHVSIINGKNNLATTQSSNVCCSTVQMQNMQFPIPGPLFQIFPPQNLLTLANSGCILMDTSKMEKLPGQSHDASPGLSSSRISVSSSPFIQLAERRYEESLTSQPIGVLVDSSCVSVENNMVHKTKELGSSSDNQQWPAEMDSMEPACQLLTVSFQITGRENVLSRTVVPMDHDKGTGIFVSSDIIGQHHNNVPPTLTSAV